MLREIAGHILGKHPCPRGAGLLEVLIAVLIFAVGLLGVAGLQTLGIKFFHDSYLRSTASLLAYDISERMRGNLAGVSAGFYDNAAGTGIAHTNCLGMDNGGNFNLSSCTTQEMAQHDFYEWNAQIQGAPAQGWTPAIQAQLPQGSGIVCIDSTPNDGTAAAPACDDVVPAGSSAIYAIKLWWTEQSDGQVHQWIESFQP